jgi:hypothetical protein
LPAGARVGTSSLRRKAQLLHAHPHLRVVPVRGNIDARLQMLESGELDAIVLAAAGVAFSSSAALQCTECTRHTNFWQDLSQKYALASMGVSATPRHHCRLWTLTCMRMCCLPACVLT